MSLKLKVFQSSDGTEHSPRRMEKSRKTKNNGNNKADDNGQFNIRNESLKYNQQVSQNISKLIVGTDCD